MTEFKFYNKLGSKIKDTEKDGFKQAQDWLE